MAAKIENALGVAAILVPQGKGVFDVNVDDDLVYSKYETGAFPDEDELVATLASKYTET